MRKRFAMFFAILFLLTVFLVPTFIGMASAHNTSIGVSVAVAHLEKEPDGRCGELCSIDL